MRTKYNAPRISCSPARVRPRVHILDATDDRLLQDEISVIESEQSLNHTRGFRRQPVSRFRKVNKGNRPTMGLGLGVPFFLLTILLLATGSGAVPQPQHKRIIRDYGSIDLEMIEVPDILPIDKEQIMSSKIPVPATRGHPVCSTCENILNKAVSYLSEKQTQDDIMEILHGACSQTFSLEQKCVEMVDSYTNLLFAKVSEIKPDDFCKQHGLCKDVTFLSVEKSESTCTLCHHLVDELLSKMKDPDAQFEIIQLLIKECDKVQGHVQQCKRMVLEYTPLILVNGEKFLEKNDVCTLMQACDTSKKAMVGSFLDGGLRSDV